MTASIRTLCLAFAFLTTGVGCTRHLLPTVQVAKRADGPVGMRVALVIDDALRASEHTYGSFATLGSANTWVCETGKGLAPALERTVRGVFTYVGVFRSAEEAQDFEVLLIPSVIELRQMPERSGFWVSFKLRALVRDPAGGVLLDKTYAHVKEGSTAAAVFGGAFGASAALLEPTELAMAEALKALRADLHSAVAQRPGQI